MPAIMPPQQFPSRRPDRRLQRKTTSAPRPAPKLGPMPSPGQAVLAGLLIISPGHLTADDPHPSSLTGSECGPKPVVDIVSAVTPEAVHGQGLPSRARQRLGQPHRPFTAHAEPAVLSQFQRASTTVLGGQHSLLDLAREASLPVRSEPVSSEPGPSELARPTTANPTTDRWPSDRASAAGALSAAQLEDRVQRYSAFAATDQTPGVRSEPGIAFPAITTSPAGRETARPRAADRNPAAG